MLVSTKFLTFGQAEDEGWFLPTIVQNIAAATLAATISLSALAGTTANLGSDDPLPAVQADEDYAQPLVAPVPATLIWPQQFTFDQQEPAGSLFGPPNEDYWQQRLVQPIVTIISLPQSSISAGTAATIADEDYWQLGPVPSVASLYQFLPYLPDSEEIPVGSLRGQPDEDFWINPTTPVPATLAWPQPFTWDIQDPAGSLSGQLDEDFWSNPVAPVPATLAWPQQWTFDVQETGGLFGQPDEDYWQNPTAPVIGVLAWPQPWVFDTQEPAGALFGQADEDFWAPPLPWPVWPSRLFSDDDVIVPQPLTPDEDFWIPAPQSIFAPVPRAFTDDEVLPLAFAPDEDYWQSFQAQIVASQVRPFTDDEVLFPQAPLFPDEDYWINPVVPVLANLYQFLPYLPDPEILVVTVAPVVQGIDEHHLGRPAMQEQGIWVFPSLGGGY